MPADTGSKIRSAIMEVKDMDKKKVTGKLGAEELEKRKAPFASPLVNTEGEGTGGGGGEMSTESGTQPPKPPPVIRAP